MRKVKNRLKELRTKKHLTLKELGEQLGMPNNTLSQYETGKREPKLETWQKLADFFGVSVPYLQGIETSTEDRIINILNKYYEKDSHLQQSVKAYLKINKVHSLPLPFYELIYSYRFVKEDKGLEIINSCWKKYFSFLFENEELPYLYSFSDKRFLWSILRRIDNELIKGGGTEISEYYYKNVLPELQTFHRKMEFDKDILFKDKEAISSDIYQLIKSLEKFENSLESMKDNNLIDDN